MRILDSDANTPLQYIGPYIMLPSRVQISPTQENKSQEIKTFPLLPCLEGCHHLHQNYVCQLLPLVTFLGASYVLNVKIVFFLSFAMSQMSDKGVLYESPSFVSVLSVLFCHSHLLEVE